MRKSNVEFEGYTLPLYSLNTLIVGSGAAALNAAVNLHSLGQHDIAIATDRWGGGTSNNAGSDKQTYYKLSLSGSRPDSPLRMADDLYAGGCMHGDIALCEAVGSVRAFFHLVDLGVPFPHDRFGAYPGYTTDHDPAGRATSTGPLTSHLMFQALAAEVEKRGITVMDGHQVVALLTADADDGGREGGTTGVIGALAIDMGGSGPGGPVFVLFNARNVILGTGGPGGMYEASVYPESQTGSTGLALEVGAVGHNLTESQFGLASTSFRWNLSGTYQQVIPRYFSTGREGGEEREFLNDYFPDMGTLADAIFLKGYQWPFDPGKIAGYGSSLIDLLVYRERVVEGRRVFLDYTRNPTGSERAGEFSLDLLGEEARTYLENSGALFGTPIERLLKMNQPAVQLYLDHGIDLSAKPLEIAVCAQHNNGGLRGSIWWESNIRHLFPVGEVNGSHGVKRPGGSALNAGQVGGQRAAQFIARRYAGDPLPEDTFLTAAGERLLEKLSLASLLLERHGEAVIDARSALAEIRRRMSQRGAHVRDPSGIEEAVADAWVLYSDLKGGLGVSSAAELPGAFTTLDLCLTHAIYLEAIREYLGKGGRSRGSYLVLDPEGEKPCDELGDEWRYSLSEPDAPANRRILEVRLEVDGDVRKEWVDVRPVPRDEQWFENLWREFRDDEVIR